MQKIKITRGDKYNLLTIIKEVEQKKKDRFVLVRCDCGIKKIMSFNHIRSGHSKSCGCLAIKLKNKHGLSRTKFYYVFRGMLNRCNNKNNSAYKNYGAKGIKIEWKSFKDFTDDMYATYQDGLSIERIDNKGNYCKENCRWATSKEQVNNRSTTIKYKGESANSADSRLGGKPGLVWNRINILGWDIDKAFTTPKS